MSRSFSNLLNSWLSVVITGYQVLRVSVLDPLLHSAFGFTSQCVYEESCSHYAQRMLRTHATIPALLRIIKRIASCHGWNRKESRVQ